MTDENTAIVVDDAPISPVKNMARRNSLEQHLKNRPDKKDLITKHILPASNAAPAIMAQQKELEKHMLADKLEGALKHRPTRDALMEKEILLPTQAQQQTETSAEEKYAEAMEEEYAKREGGA